MVAVGIERMVTSVTWDDSGRSVPISIVGLYDDKKIAQKRAVRLSDLLSNSPNIQAFSIRLS